MPEKLEDIAEDRILVMSNPESRSFAAQQPQSRLSMKARGNDQRNLPFVTQYHKGRTLAQSKHVYGSKQPAHIFSNRAKIFENKAHSEFYRSDDHGLSKNKGS